MPDFNTSDPVSGGSSVRNVPAVHELDASDTTAPIGKVTGASIVFDNVVKKYPGQAKAAVGGLSLTIPAGETVMFVGPSGCGKTTSLKMINRLIDPTSGTITIAGKNVADTKVDQLRRQVGYVIQGGSLFPHMTVADNIAVVPGLLGWDKKRTGERVDELLDMVGLDPARYRDRYPRELSGGQQQRVGVARGLAADPPVILMDEPFGAVDPITRTRLQDELLRIQRTLRKTIICVTHDIDEALKLGDRILLLSEGGHIEQYDTPENILAAPANEFVEDFVGSGSALKSLSLTRLHDIDVVAAPAVRVGTPVAEAQRLAQEKRVDSLVLVDERNRPVDYVFARKLRGSTVEGRRRDALPTVDHGATLNDALDAMLASGHSAVIVTGSRDDYRGVASFTQVMEHVQHLQEKAAERRSAGGDGQTVIADTTSHTDFAEQARDGEQA